MIFFVPQDQTRSRWWGDRLLRIHEAMNNPMTKAILLFLKSTQPTFDKLNLSLQSDEPQIHKQLDLCMQLLRELYVKFIAPDAIMKAKDIFSVEFSKRENQKNREHLVIGEETTKYLAQMKELGEMSGEDRTEFYNAVRQYFSEACQYILKKFPFKDPLLKHATVADVSKRRKAEFDSVVYLVTRFPFIVGEEKGEEVPPEKMDQLRNEFLLYQIDKDINETLRIDECWGGMDMQEKYPLLSKVMLAVLTIPHSNADPERVFSAVRRVDTEFRPNLGEKLLQSLIVNKTHNKAHNICCYNVKFSKEFLKRAKSATYKALNIKDQEETTEDADVTGEVLRLLDSNPCPKEKP